MKFGITRRQTLSTLALGSSMAAITILPACGGGRSVVEEEVAPNLIETTDANRVATFRNANRNIPSRAIRRGTSVRPLPASPLRLDGLRYVVDDRSLSIDDYFNRNDTTGLLILKRGQVVVERYARGNDYRTLWTGFSVAKSITSTLVGLAHQEGLISSLDDKVSRYVPALAGAPYGESTLRHLLRMTSGIRWNEEYTDVGESEIARFVQAIASGGSPAVMALLASLPRIAPSGSVFNYSSGESHVLGAAVTAATGTTMAEYLSRKVWASAGMESDAYWLVDGQGGLELGGGEVSATLRDFGRFGQYILEGGLINGASTLPPGWVRLASHPDNPVTTYGNLFDGYPLGYGYQWWSFPPEDSAPAGSTPPFAGLGIHGQFLYIDPIREIVAVVWSAWPEATMPSREHETFTLLSTAAGALS